jgi:transcriptional regulator with XRE-family HTH domain
VGLPSSHTRRAPGLRREEVAELAAVSVDYLVRLEQGRASTPSNQVAAALARALQLSDDERNHLYLLAHLTPPTRGDISDHISPGLQRILGRFNDSAVAVFAADWQLIWWNPGWTALLGDPSSVKPVQRNFALDTFPLDDAGPHMSQWPVTSLAGEELEAAVVSDLRRATGRFPGSSRLTSLIQTLRDGNARFAELWNSGVVGAHREDHKIVQHPYVGPIAVDCDVLIEGDTDCKIVVLTAAAQTEDETKLQLALVAGVVRGPLVR